MKNLAGKSFALLGVNSDKQISIPQKLTRDGTVTWRSFQNGPENNAISDAFNVRGWPTIILIDAKGVLRSINPGRGKDLDKAIAELLEEIGEEFPFEAVDADTKKEKAKSKTASSSDATRGMTGGMSMEERKKKYRESRAARQPWRKDKEEDDSDDSDN